MLRTILYFLSASNHAVLWTIPSCQCIHREIRSLRPDRRLQHIGVLHDEMSAAFVSKTFQILTYRQNFP
jgi:hypothetical protein